MEEVFKIGEYISISIACAIILVLLYLLYLIISKIILKANSIRAQAIVRLLNNRLKDKGYNVAYCKKNFPDICDLFFETVFINKDEKLFLMYSFKTIYLRKEKKVKEVIDSINKHENKNCLTLKECLSVLDKEYFKNRMIEDDLLLFDILPEYIDIEDELGLKDIDKDLDKKITEECIEKLVEFYIKGYEQLLNNFECNDIVELTDCNHFSKNLKGNIKLDSNFVFVYTGLLPNNNKRLKDICYDTIFYLIDESFSLEELNKIYRTIIMDVLEKHEVI